MGLGDGLIESLALCRCDFDLQGSGLAGAVATLSMRHTTSESANVLVVLYKERERDKEPYRKSPRAPRTPAMHLLQVRQLPERRLVPQRHIDHAMMREGAHGRDASRLLPSAQAGGGDEEPRVLAPETALHPLAAGAVEEGLPLGGEVAVAGGNAEEHAIVLLELGGRDFGDGGVLGRGVHLGEDFFRKGFFDSARQDLVVLFFPVVMLYWGGEEGSV